MGAEPNAIATTALAAVEVSIVLPCLNEAATIESCVNDAWTGLHRLGVVGEVIVADNGSHDESRSTAARAGARVEVARLRGYGAALRHGIAAARGEFVIIADADGSYDLTKLDDIWRRLQAGDDLVIGNRFRGHIAKGAMPALNRYLGNPVLSALGRALTHTLVGDFHSGLRGFRKSSIDSLRLRSSGMEFSSEMIARASEQCLSITEVAINLSKDRRSGTKSHLRPARDGLRHLTILVRMRSGADRSLAASSKR